MRKILFILAFSFITAAYAQETGDNESPLDEDYDFGMAEGITVYGERPIDAYVLERLNGLSSDRKRFIETDFLEEAGFRRNGNVRYRRSNGSEKHLRYCMALDICSVSVLYL